MSNIKARVFVEYPINKGKQIVLKDKEYNYLIHVMRLKVGDSLTLLDGKNGEFVGSISAIEKKTCTISVGKNTRRFEKSPELYLAFAPIKRIEMIAEKGTELGVTEFIPIITQRTIVKKINLDKFFSHVKEAVEQCERLDMPTIRDIVKLDKFISTLSTNDIIILCDEEKGRGADSAKFKASKVLNEIKNKGIKGQIYVLVGPEGGFSPEELETIRKNRNVYSVSLGKRILRAETAVVVILALIQEYLL